MKNKKMFIFAGLGFLVLLICSCCGLIIKVGSVLETRKNESILKDKKIAETFLKDLFEKKWSEVYKQTDSLFFHVSYGPSPVHDKYKIERYDPASGKTAEFYGTKYLEDRTKELGLVDKIESVELNLINYVEGTESSLLSAGKESPSQSLFKGNIKTSTKSFDVIILVVGNKIGAVKIDGKCYVEASSYCNEFYLKGN